jgi:pumilio family protein 6
LEKKPNLREPILGKLEKVAVKLVEKGLTRHTIVQAIMKDYIETQDIEKVKNMAETIKSNIPTLLASKEGLKAACGFFNILDAKDRKAVVKSFKAILPETLTNKIAHLFVVHMINTLDDTVLTKKKLLTEMLKNIDEQLTEKSFQNVVIGSLAGFEKRCFGSDERDAHVALLDHTTSKKDEKTRLEEFAGFVTKPLTTFMEEHLADYISDSKSHLLRILMTSIVTNDSQKSYEDFMDEFFRQI